MNVFEKMENMEHEQLMFFNDNKTGLKGIIGIHNSVLGPALGGTRRNGVCYGSKVFARLCLL